MASLMVNGFERNEARHRHRELLSATLLLIATTLVLLLSSCSTGKRPIATARVCLPDPSDVGQLVTLLRMTGQTYGMTFFDQTQETRADRKALGDANKSFRTDGFVLNAGVLRPDGMGVTVNELAGPGLQVALGFSQGKDAGEAKKFTEAVSHKIEQRWRIQLFEDGSGVQPFDHCP